MGELVSPKTGSFHSEKWRSNKPLPDGWKCVVSFLTISTFLAYRPFASMRVRWPQLEFACERENEALRHYLKLGHHREVLVLEIVAVENVATGVTLEPRQDRHLTPRRNNDGILPSEI